MINFNEKQIKAIESQAKQSLVVAGAGSGKTTMIIERIRRQLEAGADESRILAITFTNNAANEMQERLESRLGYKSQVEFSTIHAWAYRMLIKHQERYRGRNVVIDEMDVYYLLENALFDVGYTEEDIKEIVKAGGNRGFNLLISIPNMMRQKEVEAQTIINLINQTNPSLVRLLTEDFEKMEKAFNIYNQKYEELNKLTFDDILYEMYKMLRDEPEIREAISKSYDKIYIDEFQDVSDVQAEIVNMIVNEDTELFVVGDVDQCIYEWRGARPDIMLKLPLVYPDMEVYVVNDNYRSKAEILELSNNLIENSKNRFEKDLLPTRGAGGYHSVHFETYDNDWIEGRQISYRVSNLLSNGYNERDIAILCRNTAQFNHIESALRALNINVEIVGGRSIYEQVVGRDILAFLKVMTSQDILSIYRIINIPARGIGPKAMNDIIAHMERRPAVIPPLEWLSLIDSLNKKATEGVNQFVEMMSEAKEQLMRDDITETDKAFYVASVFRGMGLYEYYDKSAKDKIDFIIDDLINYTMSDDNHFVVGFADHMMLTSSEPPMDNEEDTRVRLMTIHASKGMEFGAVFVPGLDSKRYRPTSEEERRNLYVALTRAKDKLYLSYAQGSPSVFVDEMTAGDENYFENL